MRRIYKEIGQYYGIDGQTIFDLQNQNKYDNDVIYEEIDEFNANREEYGCE